jgi:hypothetical protein
MLGALGLLILKPEWVGQLAGWFIGLHVAAFILALTGIIKGLELIWTGMVKAIESAFNGDLWNAMKAGWGFITDPGKIANFLGNIFSAFGDLFGRLTSAIGPWFGDLWEGFKRGFKDILKSTGTWDDFQGFMGDIHKAFDGLMKGAKYLWDHFLDPIVDAGVQFAKWIDEVLGTWNPHGLLGDIHNAFDGLVDGILFLVNPFKPFLDWIGEAAGWIKDKMGSWNPAGGGMGFLNAMHWEFNVIKSGIETFGNIFAPLLGWIGEVFSKVFDVFGQGTGGISYIITHAIDLIETALSTAASPFRWILAWIDGLFNPGSTFNWFLGKWQWLMDHTSISLGIHVDDPLGILDKIGGIPGAIGNNLPFGWGGQFGGIVPGRIGQKQLVVAEAGERMMGHPYMGGRSPRVQSMDSGGGAPSLIINVTNSVITNREAMDELAETIFGKVYGRMRTTTRMSLHRG